MELIAFIIGRNYCKNGKGHGQDSVDCRYEKKDSLMDHWFTYISLRDTEEKELMQSLLTPTNFGHASFRNESALKAIS